MPTKNDPNAPKRPKTAFLCFSQGRRLQLAKQHPNWKFGQFGKAIGAEWAKMSDSAKKKYVTQSEKDQARYKKEMSTYVPPPKAPSNPPGEDGKKKRRRKDPNAPKRALTPYVFFLSKRRPELAAANPKWTFNDLGKALGKEWGKMSDSAKKPYVAKAQKDQKRFEKEMSTYVPPKIEPEEEKGRKKRKKKDPNAPKRALTPYVFYLAKRRPELTSLHPDWGFGQFGKTIGAEWSKMSDKAKAPYVKKAEKDAQRFEKEMAKFKPSPPSW